jgi:uncharacterized protein YjiS (DUF1127 family)
MRANISRGSVPTIGPVLGTNTPAVSTRVLRFLRAAIAVSAERHALAGLNDRMLKDIGITRSEADLESRRDFFDIPEGRIPRR